MRTLLPLLCIVLRCDWVCCLTVVSHCFGFVFVDISPTFTAFLVSISVLLCMSLWLCASRDKPSAKSRSPSDSMNVLLTHVSVLVIIQYIAMQNRNGNAIGAYTLALHQSLWRTILLSVGHRAITFFLNPSCNIFMKVTILQGIP